MERYCQKCGCKLTTERKWCSKCRKENKRAYAKEHYRNLIDSGHKLKRYGIGKCIYCGEDFIKNSVNQLSHRQCYLQNVHKTVEKYNAVPRAAGTVNTIGRQFIINLGFSLTSNMCVHHLDENPSNNKLSNLSILNRRYHAELHRLLEKNWSLLLKNNSSNLENCWNTLRGQLTKAWLETKSANVIKIVDIGQSAAEPLNEDNIYVFSQEEGSETMYQAPKRNKSHGEDIVQTQTK